MANLPMKGDNFHGYHVEASVDKDEGHVWVFSRSGLAVAIGIKYDVYFEAMISLLYREEFLDQLAMELYEKFKDKKPVINSLQTEN